MLDSDFFAIGLCSSFYSHCLSLSLVPIIACFALVHKLTIKPIYREFDKERKNRIACARSFVHSLCVRKSFLKCTTITRAHFSHSFSMFCQFSLLSFSVWIKFRIYVGRRLQSRLFFSHSVGRSIRETSILLCTFVRVWSLPATWFQSCLQFHTFWNFLLLFIRSIQYR